MRNIPFVFGTAAVLIFLAVALAIGGKGGQVRASHGGPDVIGVDFDVTGNTATSLGTIDSCAQASPGNTVTFDLFATGIPPYNDNGTPADFTDDTGGIIGWQFTVQYDEAPFTIQTEDQDFLVYSSAGSAPFSVSDPLPDTDGNNEWISGSLDIGLGTPESASGVISRITIEVDAAAAIGLYTIVVDPVSSFTLDTNNVVVQPAHVLTGRHCRRPGLRRAADRHSDANADTRRLRAGRRGLR